MFEIMPLDDAELKQFKSDMQAAFQQGAIDGLGSVDGEVLPEKDIDGSLSAEGAIAYKAVVDGEMVGGAVVVIDRKTGHNHLDFLYVKNGMQGKGIGRRIWESIERLHPDTVVWETCTPYFDVRNINFYINSCGFHAVEFFSRFHKGPKCQEDYERPDGYFNGLFRFEKRMDATDR